MIHTDPQLLDKYAQLAIRVGLNLKPGQRLLMAGMPVQLAPLVRLLTKHAYQAGARFVDIVWADEELDRLRLKYAHPDTLDEFPDWLAQVNVDYLEAGDAFLRIYARDPELMAEQDPAALKKLLRVQAEKMAQGSALISQFSTNWSIISGALATWARRVFPGLSEADAEARLWDTIFTVCRVKEDDPIASWAKHLGDLAARRDYLNAKAYQKLQYRAPGTNLIIGLPVGHHWVGGSEVAKNGIACVPNMPTEEVATIPHRERINGIVSSTKPLSRGGVIMDNFSLTFENGRVIKATAEKGQAALEDILETDEGALSLGEVALVPHSSPISQSGVLFYNTLFDENASCHLALGRAYKACMRGGGAMTDDEFQAAGGNVSLIHVDFMVGSAEMDIDGYREDGMVEAVMRSGEWAFAV